MIIGRRRPALKQKPVIGRSPAALDAAGPGGYKGPAMNAPELERILAGLPGLAVAVLGDFGLDRYLAIDPDIQDLSAETGLPIHQVVAVRNSPGGGGVVLANLAALGVGKVLPV